jgi:hypothetical protein
MKSTPTTLLLLAFVLPMAPDPTRPQGQRRSRSELYAGRPGFPDFTFAPAASSPDAPPLSLAYGVDVLSLSVGATVGPFTPTVVGGPASYYTVTGFRLGDGAQVALPPGITFDTSSGVLSGTATELWAASRYRFLAWRGGRAAEDSIDISVTLPLPADWYSGDSHDHTQSCDGSLLSLAAITDRLQDELLSVSSVLIWQPFAGPYSFVSNVCSVTGMPEPTAAGHVQYGVETSGLSASKFGHLIGTDIGPTQARIATANTAFGACYTATNPMALACPATDGTGYLNYKVAQWFKVNPNAVVGYAHQAWPTGIYHASGYDWSGHAAAGYSLDVALLDVGQKLAFPPLASLIAGPAQRNTFPLFGPIDVALGDIDFLECADATLDFSLGIGVPAYWWGAWDKLLSAGLRVSISAGSDWVCRPAIANEAPRTYAKVTGGLTYRNWMQAVKAGRVTIAQGGETFIHMTVNGAEVGSEVNVSSPATITASITVISAGPLTDTVDLIVGGTQVASSAVSLPSGGTAVVPFGPFPLNKSAWCCARLRSELARTAAHYVLLDSAPIVDDLTCEYWMVWCDALTKILTENPAVLDCQQSDALARIAAGRAVFKALRDLP